MLELECRQRPGLADRLRTVESIGPCPIPPVVVGRRLPEPTRQRLQALLGMHHEPGGRAILADGLIARFVRVRDDDYDPIREMVRRAAAARFPTLL